MKVMSRKTYTFEEFESLYNDYLSKGIILAGYYSNNAFYKEEVCEQFTRIVILYNKVMNEDMSFCILDDKVVRITPDEWELLAKAFASTNQSYSDVNRTPYRCHGLSDFEKQEADKLYIEFSGHEPDDSYSWLEYPDGNPLHGPMNYPGFYYSN